MERYTDGRGGTRRRLFVLFPCAQVCVWLGANQQVRAATSVLRALELLERPEGPLSLQADYGSSGVRLQASLSSGRVVAGNIGLKQKMPLFYGSTQVDSEVHFYP